MKIMNFLTDQTLPTDSQEAKIVLNVAKIVLNVAKRGYIIVDDILYYEGEEAPNRRRVVVPAHLKQRILDEHHDLPFSGHFAAKKD